MAHREFTDADGVQWQAWEVIPLTGERRAAGERRFGARDRLDRRTRQQLRVKMEDGLAHGWLVFESATEKRRLHPIPEGWSSLPDTELANLVRTVGPGARPERGPGRPNA